MNCKNHPTDPTAAVGVCASCLRDRLLAVIEAQGCRKPHAQQQLPPLAFPRSASPYISRVQPDATEQRHQRFCGTPLPGGGGSRGGRSFSSLFSGLFKSRSDSGQGNPPQPFSASPSWLSAVDSRRDRDRPTFPARYSADEHFRGGSSGCPSPQCWPQTPRRTPATVRRVGGRNVSTGLGFCLSPLVRPSPNLQRNQKGIPAEGGESGVPANGRPSTAFCKSRSRKLADFGRYSCSSNR